MPKSRQFIVSVPLNFSLETVIEAETEEEAIKKADELEPTEFDNFDVFYEWLGYEYRRLKEGMKIIK